MAEALVAPDRLPELDRSRACCGPEDRSGACSHRADWRPVASFVGISAVRGGAGGYHLGVRSSTRLLRRTYVIVLGGRSVAAVSEWICPGRLAAATPAVTSDFVVDL